MTGATAQLQEMVRLCLIGEGYELVVAVDGVDALNRLNGRRADLVIVEFATPDSAGIEVIRCIHALPNHRFTPIVVVLSDASAQRKAEGQGAGVTGWVLRPVEPMRLLKEIRRVLPR